MIDLKEPEVLFHTAALGHTGALETELDYRATDGGCLGHSVCIQISDHSILMFQMLVQSKLTISFFVKCSHLHLSQNKGLAVKGERG